MKLQKLTAVTFLLGISVSFFGGTAHANLEEIVTSIHGGAPYMVVYPDDQSPSKRNPGIYVRNGDAFVQALPGVLTPAQIKGGFGTQLSLSKLTNRYEVVGILNQNLVVLSVHSKDTSPNSFLEIGQNITPIVNPLDGTTFTLPPIQKAEDVCFYEGLVPDKDGNKLEVVFVSLKNPSPLGSGITFALVFKPDQNTGQELKLAYSPILLDWEFSDTQTLSNKLILSQTHKMGILSSNLLRHYSKEQPNDQPPVRKWRETLKQVLEGKIKASEVQSMTDALPFLIITNGQIEVGRLPSVAIPRSNNHAIFDPIYGNSFVGTEQNVSLSAAQTMQPLASGVLDCVGTGCETATSSDASDKSLPIDAKALHPSFGVFKLQTGKVFLLINSSDAIEIRPTDSSFLHKRPTRVSVYFCGPNYLLVSWDFSDFSNFPGGQKGNSSSRQFTALYKLVNSGEGFKIKDSMTLTNQYFSSEQLSWRLSKHGDLVLFNDSTKNVDSKEEYDRLYRKTAPHLDLEATLKTDKLQVFFPEALQVKSFSPRITFQSFEPHPLTNRTGLYATKPNSQILEPLVQGELLILNGTNPEIMGASLKEGVLDSVQLEIKEKGKFEVIAVAIDSSFSRGKAQAKLTILISPDSQNLPVIAHNIGLLQGKDTLQSFVFVKPQKTDNIHTAVAVIAIKNQGTFLYPLALMQTPEGVSISTSVQGFQISDKDTPISLKETQARLRFDTKTQRPFWIETTDISETSQDFKVKEVFTGSIVYPNRGKSGIKLTGGGFGEDYVARSAPWRVYGFDAKKAEAAKPKNTGEYQTDVFPHIKELLDDLANPEKPARHVVLLVPPELRKYIESYILALKDRKTNRPPHWNSKNYGLQFYVLDPAKKTQDDALESLSEMHKSVVGLAKARSVLYGTLADVQAMGRLQNEDPDPKKIFKIEDRKIDGVDFGTASDGTEVGATSESIFPHLLYLLATEGEKTPIQEFKPRSHSPQFSTILVGTQKEWDETIKAAELEKRHGIDQSYDVIELEAPTQATRQNFVTAVLNRPELKQLDYRIDIQSFDKSKDPSRITPEETLNIVAAYLVNRAESLSSASGARLFEGFMRALNILATELTSNPKFRAKKVIDRALIETALSKVFSMPLSLNLLEEDDPLKILSRPDAAFLWQQTGYQGPLALKKKVIKNILNQLTADEEKHVPSSMIVYGDSGSGKSYLFQTLVKMLRLKLYNISGDHQENSDSTAFFLSLNQVRDPEIKGAGNAELESMINLEDAASALEKFLSLPNGHRGFIWLDDVHLASPKVKTYFLKRMRTLLENPTYTATVDGDAVERPTRNLFIGISMNPTDNQEKIKRFTKGGKTPTDHEVILATLSSGDGSEDLDQSWLKRWGLVLNLNFFPVEAKAPKLLENTRKSAKTVFDISQVHILVSPDAIEAVVKAFPNEDARTFLSTATRTLVKSPKTDTNRIIIRTPRRRITDLLADIEAGTLGRSSSTSASSSFAATGNDASAAIESFIESEIEEIAVDTSIRGKIEFTRYVLNNIRRRAYDIILRAASEDPAFSLHSQEQRLKAQPLSRAVYHHLKREPLLTMEFLNLDPVDFGIVSQGDKDQFKKLLRALILEEGMEKPIVPPVGEPPESGTYRAFVGDTLQVKNQSRQHVLARHIENLSRIFENLLTQMLQVKNLHEVSSFDAWFKDLQNSDVNLTSTVGNPVLRQLEQYLAEIINPMLAEAATATKEAQLSQYDAMRIFTLAFDRALSRLPWGKISNFLIQVLKRSAEDLTVGQSRLIQNFLFEGRSSPFRPLDMGLILGLATSISDAEGNEDALKRQDGRFMSICETLLTGGKSK